MKRLYMVFCVIDVELLSQQRAALDSRQIDTHGKEKV